MLDSHGINADSWPDDHIRKFGRLKLTDRFRVTRSYRANLDRVQEQARATKEIQCPFCHDIQTFKNEQTWRRHVYSDLRAYVCTFRRCDNPLFDDMNDWFKHEMQCHRINFSCPICHEIVFHTEAPYLDHVQNHHPALIINGNDRAILDIGKCSLRQIPTSDCPCCTEWPTDSSKQSAATHQPQYVSPDIFKRHLASHLEQLALLALPTPLSGEHREAPSVLMRADQEGRRRFGSLSGVGPDLHASSRPGSPVQEKDFMLHLNSSPSGGGGSGGVYWGSHDQLSTGTEEWLIGQQENIPSQFHHLGETNDDEDDDGNDKD